MNPRHLATTLVLASLLALTTAPPATATNPYGSNDVACLEQNAIPIVLPRHCIVMVHHRQEVGFLDPNNLDNFLCAIHPAFCLLPPGPPLTGTSDLYHLGIDSPIIHQFWQVFTCIPEICQAARIALADSDFDGGIDGLAIQYGPNGPWFVIPIPCEIHVSTTSHIKGTHCPLP